MDLSIDKKIVDREIEGSTMKALEGTALRVTSASWKSTLYREVSHETEPVRIRLIPHYAYGNRGLQDMTVFMPVAY